MFYIRRFLQTSNFVVLCSLVLAVAFLFQCKVLYQAYQKRLRFNEYNDLINEMTNSLQVMEKVISKTDYLMKILKKSVKMKTKKLRKGTTQAQKLRNG